MEFCRLAEAQNAIAPDDWPGRLGGRLRGVEPHNRIEHQLPERQALIAQLAGFRQGIGAQAFDNLAPGLARARLE
jgi:hypothetical protein